jgi:hypothetical protein
MTEGLERSAEKRNCTKAEALRCALSLLFAADDAKEEGFPHVGAWRQDGNTRIEREFVAVV